MMKELLQYVHDLMRPEVVTQEVRGEERIYSTKDLNKLDLERPVKAINVRSLSGMVHYIKSNFDHERALMIHIESPTKVNLFDALNKDHDRRVYVEAEAMLPEITLERYMSREQFNIMLQACFVTVESDKEVVLRAISSIVEDESITLNDDGFSQNAVVKTGIATRGEADIPNPVKLRPFRTFVEVSQPPSNFVLRIGEGAKIGLFEADGGAWELNAMANIEEHLKIELGDLIDEGKVIIIA